MFIPQTTLVLSYCLANSNKFDRNIIYILFFNYCSYFTGEIFIAIEDSYFRIFYKLNIRCIFERYTSEITSIFYLEIYVI